MSDNLLHILAVDDEPSVRFSLSYALASPNRKLATACDGSEALEKIASHDSEIDIVITDNNMPKVSGLDLVKRLRETKFAGKIVVLSAFLDGEIRNAYANLGVDLMVAKPFEIVAFRAAIQNLTEA